jgi:ElaB/YqjD/DUF883 family membrane-anchored ribosome-binding protein
LRKFTEQSQTWSLSAVAEVLGASEAPWVCKSEDGLLETSAGTASGFSCARGECREHIRNRKDIMTTQEANERLASDLKLVMRDAEDLLKATAGQAGEKITEVRSRLAGALESAKATYAQIQDKTVLAAKATDRVIRDHPYESLGISFGVGLLIGVLVTRK